jgi:hypothetical protein
VAINLKVSNADYLFEAAFPKPEFGILWEGATLIDRLYARLEPHSLCLNDVRFDRGSGSFGDHHYILNLFNSSLCSTTQ